MPLHRYLIPAFVYAPKIIEPQTVSKLSSQIDLMPTVMSLMNWDYRGKFYGNDILADDFVEQAFVGNWLGTAGPLPVDAGRFRVLDNATGKPVLEGTLTRRAVADPWSGNDVYTADFTALQTNGHYRLEVPGLGRSDSFRIAPDVYDPVYRTVARHFYHHRNSTTIRAPWAAPGHERPGGPLDDVGGHAPPGEGPSPHPDDHVDGGHGVGSGLLGKADVARRAAGRSRAFVDTDRDRPP